MTMRKRRTRRTGNRRSITIDSKEYHYKFLSIERAAIAIIQLVRGSSSSCLFLETGGVNFTPARIGAAIRFGIASGWEPSRNNEPISLAAHEDYNGNLQFRSDETLNNVRVYWNL